MRKIVGGRETKARTRRAWRGGGANPEVASGADYVRRYATPEALLSRNPNGCGKSSDDGSDAKMDGDDDSEAGFLSSSEDEEGA
ncbi:hypothetical protein Rsub_06024 [Raphidocelis subcapitata]|uniref:Uncharacterized protein n=1 Tax=Raphidocelis subcapitata TaxID=307507 RepID=A0A2V0P314_9CHLO|nr:hypothetical protein Rsub_06024 [Raphidocelis subcapitata]|eukprot:GBF93292.1 hypothetical protein Rsub_06024 [Raphidocelis subcapitata]